VNADTSPSADQAAIAAGQDIDATLREALIAVEAEWQDEAILYCERALKIDPDCAEAVFLLGLVYFDMNEAQKAIETIETAHRMNPQRREIAEALAAMMVRVGKLNEALFYAKLATALEPHPSIDHLLPDRFGTFFKNMDYGDPNLYAVRARRSLDKGNTQDAFEYARRQLELTPDNAEALSIMLDACLTAGKYEASVGAARELLALRDPDPKDLASLGSALAALGHTTEADTYHSEALRRAPDDAAMHSRILAEQVRRPGQPAERLAALHAVWNRQHAGTLQRREIALGTRQDPERTLRIGYVSGSFHGSEFAELFEPVLHAHKAGKIETYCYHEGMHSDTTTEILMRSATKWTNITRIDDETVWEIMRGDEIDIAVDLTGHFAGGRPLMFARHPAPVTVSWLGYPHPLGLPGIDYFLSDQVLSPKTAGAKAPQDDGVWRLPRSPFAYIAQTSIPDVAEPPATASKRLTYGANCDLSLLTPDLIRIWTGILTADDSASLILCNGRDLDSASIQRVLNLFAIFGLRERVTIVNKSENFETEFAFYHHIDIALDTGSCASLVENCRALWMGVPVIGVTGQHPATRQGLSILEAAGHPEWAVSTPEALVELAAKLSGDLGAIATRRAGLRAEIKKSKLGNPVDLARSLETAYREMWRKRCAAG
jgi:protein O-GlcNAc transferase